MLDGEAATLRLTPVQLAALTVAGIAGTINIGVLPMLVGAFADTLHLTAREGGYLATSEYLGGGIGAALAPVWLRRGTWRKSVVIFSVAGMCLTLLSAAAVNLPWLLILRVCNGAALSSLYALGVYCIGRSHQPDRFYGIFFTAQLIAYSATAFAMPACIRVLGLFGVAAALGCWSAATLLVARLMPIRVSNTSEPTPADRRAKRINSTGLIAIAALLAFMLSVHGVWAFVERIGSHAGISYGQVAATIGQSGASGALGSVAAALLGTRLGRFLPSLVATSAVVGGFAFLIAASDGYLQFAIGVNLYSFGWLLAIPYFMGAVTTQDQSSTLTQLLPFAQLAAGAAAPTMAGWLADRHGFASVPGASMAVAITAGILLAVSLNQARRNSR